MPSIVLKKTSNERGVVEFSFHGTFVSKEFIEHVNDALSTIPRGCSNNLFVWEEERGHYSYCQSSNSHDGDVEEDVLVEILEVVECMNWKLQQHQKSDSSSSSSSQFSTDNAFSSSGSGSSETQTTTRTSFHNTTSKECWIFQKEPIVYELHKAHAHTNLGVVFNEIDTTDGGGNSNSRKLLVIKNVIDGGLFYRNDVPAGIVVLSINGIPCRGKLPHQISSLLYESVGTITLLTTTVI